MASATLESVTTGIQDRLKAMIERGRSPSTYLKREILKQFQQAQIQRWQTQGASEGENWAPLTEKYAKYKKKEFASYDGAGNVLMVATGKLASGAQARDPSRYVNVVTDSSFVLSVNTESVPYAEYPGIDRPYMEFSDDTIARWKQGLRDYVAGVR